MAKQEDTVRQIAFQLGLKPPGEYVPPVVAQQRRRQLGRSTNLILWALSDVARGTPVMFMGPTKEVAAEMVYRAREYARRLGLDPQKILRPPPYGSLPPSQWPQGAKVYRDHQMNHGGPVHEPQETTTNGLEPLSVACPWCSKPIKEPLGVERFHEGTEIKRICACGMPVLIRVQRVRTTIEAWRGEHEDPSPS